MFDCDIAAHFRKVNDYPQRYNDRILLVDVLMRTVKKLSRGTFELVLTGSLAYGCSLHSGDIDFVVVCKDKDKTLAQQVDHFDDLLLGEKFAETLNPSPVNTLELVELVSNLYDQEKKQLCQAKFSVNSGQLDDQTNVFFVEFSFREGISCGTCLAGLRKIPMFYVLTTCLKSIIIANGLFGTKRRAINGISIAVIAACSLKGDNVNIASCIENATYKGPTSRDLDVQPSISASGRNYDIVEAFKKMIDFIIKWNFEEYEISIKEKNSFVKRKSIDDRHALIVRGFDDKVNLAESVSKDQWLQTVELLKAVRDALFEQSADAYNRIVKLKTNA